MPKPVLKIYDDNGVEISIPAIVGKRGESGVFVGTGTPPAGTKVQIDPEGTVDMLLTQVTTMPTASAIYAGKSILYTGETGTYKNGCLYACVASDDVLPVYSWAQIGTGDLTTHNNDAGAHATEFGAVDTRIDGITNQYGNRFARAFGERLITGVEPSCLLLLGDSTGNDNIEWFKTSMDWLATKHPKISFEQRLWSDTHQNYSGNISYIQTGSSGDGYIAFDGISNQISTPDAVALRITGDLDITVKYSIDDWVKTGVIPVLASKFGASGNRGWALLMSPTRARPSLYFSTDGAATKGGPDTTYESNADISIADGNAIWIRCTFDVDNGAGGCDLKFYTSSDGATWTQLGTTVTNTGTTSIYASTAPLLCGIRETGGTYFAGKFYRMILRNGINGKIVASPSAGSAHPLGTTSMKDAEGNTWTVSGNAGGSPLCICLNASKPGAAVNYSADVARFALQTPIEPQLAFVSYSHNEGTKTAYQSEYSALLTQILTKYSYVGIVCVTQSPQKSPMTIAQVNAHASRNRQIALVAAINNYGLIDAYRAFVRAGADALIESDGVHPTAAGDIVWRDAAIQFLLAATLD